MKTLYIAMEKSVLIARQHRGDWQVESHLDGLQAFCLAADPLRPECVYCGTYRRGLWRSRDAGHTWQPIGDLPMMQRSTSDIRYSDITALAVSATERAGEYGVVYVGTEPSAMFRSEDGGTSWQELASFRELPSSSTWSFPPRPETHHVRWITPDPHVAGHVFVSVEAGAVVRTLDGGVTWEDRVPDGPFDAHTLLIHPAAPGRLYAAAGDGFVAAGKGYQESLDGGRTWQYPDEGLHHHYLYGAAVNLADPDTILVSASTTPETAHFPPMAESFVYRKTKRQPWQIVTNGLPEARGCMAAAFGTTPTEPDAFYLLSNQGCYRSPDAGQHWERLDLPWNEQLVYQHPQALTIAQE